MPFAPNVETGWTFVMAAVPLRAVDGAGYEWGEGAVCVLGRGQLVPDPQLSARGADVAGWAVYAVYDLAEVPHLWWVSDRTGQPSNLPFSAVWDVVHRPPTRRIIAAVEAYLESRGQ